MVSVNSLYKVRNPQIDLMRVVGSFFVILVHACALRYFNTSSIMSVSIFIILKIIGTIGASLFVISSGYLLLDPKFNIKSVWSFYKLRIQSLIIPMIIWALVYIYYTRSPLLATLLGLFKVWDITAVPYFHFYFLKIFMILYIFTPFIKKLFSSKQWSSDLILSVLLVIALINIAVNNLIIYLLSFFIYFIIGYKVRLYEKIHELKVTKLILTVLVCFAACIPLALFEYFLHGVRPGDILITLSYFNPFIVMAGTCLFILLLKIRNIKYAYTINRMGELSMHVFLVHAILLNFFIFIPSPITRSFVIFVVAYLGIYVFFTVGNLITNGFKKLFI